MLPRQAMQIIFVWCTYSAGYSCKLAILLSFTFGAQSLKWESGISYHTHSKARFSQLKWAFLFYFADCSCLGLCLLSRLCQVATYYLGCKLSNHSRAEHGWSMNFLKGLQQPQKPTNASTGCFGASTLVTLLAFWETLIQPEFTVEHSETWRFDSVSCTWPGLLSLAR